jgi:hypothetical protein
MKKTGDSAAEIKRAGTRGTDSHGATECSLEKHRCRIPDPLPFGSHLWTP